MRTVRTSSAFVFALLLCLAPGTAVSAEPELLSANPFSVGVANGIVDVTFTLTMSEVSSYPVTITAISGSTEEVLYQGTLGEGVYRFSAPLTKISGSGDLKVVLKTRVTNRSDKGNESFIVYHRWQGRM